jgi:hypothetical protein
MKTSYGKLWAVFAAVLLAGSLPASSQSATADPRAVRVEPTQAGGILPAGPVARQIDDPSTGTRWLLAHDPAHPEGPGRFVLSANSSLGSGSAASGSVGDAKGLASVDAQRFVIHVGDALLVEEHTAVVDAQLEAVALGSAVRGAEFKARLRIGGKVVRVLASGPGRSALVREDGARQ